MGPDEIGCLPKQRFIAVTHEYITIPSDGVLGLAYNTDGPFYELIKAGYYKPIFALQTGKHDDSRITFGGVDKHYKKADEAGIPFTKADSNDWSVDVGGLSFNGQTIDDIEYRGAKLDLSSPMLTLPKSVFTNFKTTLADPKFPYKTTQSSSGQFTIPKTNCPERDFPSLKFSFSEIEGKATIDAEIPGISVLKQNGADCDIMIQEGDKYILGDPFLINYYLVFDQDNDKIGITKSSTNQFPGPVDPKSDFPMWIVIAAVVVALVLVVIVVLICRRRRGNQDDEARAIYKQVEERTNKEETYE